MKKLRIFLLMAAVCSILVAAIVSVAYAGTYNNRYNITIVDEDNVPIGSNKVVVTVYNAGTTTVAGLYTNTSGDSDAETVAGTFTTSTGDINFYGGDVTYDFVVVDSPLVTTQIKRTSVAPTTHKIMFPQLRTYSLVGIVGKLQTLTDSDTCPVVTSSYCNTGTTTATINNFQFKHDSEVGLKTGQFLMVVSKGAITYDVTTSGIVGGTTDIITADGDIVTFFYDGTSWRVISFFDQSENWNS